VASPREGGGSDDTRITRARARLAAACFAFTILDASAHGSAGLEWVVFPFFVFVGGFIATFAVYVWLGSRPLLQRLIGGVVFVLVDFAMTLVLGAVVVWGVKLLVHTNQALDYMIWLVSVCPWVLPAILSVMLRRGARL
jgi:hypothetical protein